MKKIRLKWLIFSMIVLSLVIVIGGIKVYNDFFPMAKCIQFPDIERITSVKISKDDLVLKYSDNKNIKLIMGCLLNANATRILSVNDAPTVNEYYEVNVIEEDSNRYYTSYIYQENSIWYVEQPYWGVYEMGKDMPFFFEGRSSDR